MSAPRKPAAQKKKARAAPVKRAAKKRPYNKTVTTYHRRTVRGRGDYTMDPEASFGHRYGGLIGSKLGELAGGSLQGLLAAVTGLGDYQVKENVFLDGRLPEMINMPAGGGTVIRFQEYLGDVTTSPTIGEFDIQSYEINAANPETFPFLSQIAANYEQYCFEGIIFQYKSTSADALNSTNTALGSVMMATQYDSLDPVFDSKLDMLNYEFSSSCKPSEDVLHMVECAPRQTSVSELYTLYNQGVPSNADPRLYNLGRFSIATIGFQAANVRVGQLHVTYQVRLLKPKLFVSLGKTSLFSLHTLGNGTAPVFSNTEPLGISSSIPDANIKSNTSEVIIEPTKITLPASSAKLAYRIEAYWYGTVAVAITMPTVSIITNGTVSSLQGVGATLTSNSCMLMIGVQTGGNDQVCAVDFSISGVALPAGNQQVIVRVMQVDPTFLAQ